MENVLIPKNDFNNIMETLFYLKENFVSKKDMENYIETIEILNNRKTMKSIEQSRQDIETGRVKELESFKDLIKEVESE